MTLNHSLDGRVALVSGASSGIGRHLSLRLAAAGAKVILGARRTDRTQDLACQIEKAGGQALAVPLDVVDEASVGEAYDRGEAHFGTVDTIIANAGVSRAGRSTDVSAQDLKTVFDTNLLGLYLTVRTGAKRMIEAGMRDSAGGRVVLIGSVTADMTNQGDAAYAASKAGVAHLGRQFAREWVRQGINVNTIQPGYIRTEMADEWFDSDGGKAQIASWHRRRLMDLETLDDMALYLASDASRFVTGSAITIDDGQGL
ncbi:MULTISPECIES: SDR family NAD(P)-dependent oxidoreductase [Citromicrobium]|uniref:SDR family NAD(P)-dependent oxidoreductase n=1 Tax=Citromicrobium TaxID=72173 RepID=UPI0001DD0A36|nr:MULTISPECIES: SDR family NAD(P)-dependent oxidoreductase [Citromicrobium]ALG60445.1 short-chain dehydrogenase [Citromicrobium sp. JL477]